jgi:hypothetical protein
LIRSRYGIWKGIWRARHINSGIDGILHLYCNREVGPSEMAYQTEEHECRDLEVGSLWCRCRNDLPHSRYLLLTLLCSSKQSNLSMTMHPLSTALSESGRYIRVKVENGEWEALKS